jgi:transposase
MTFVPIKTAEQQAQAMVLGIRDLLVNQRTQTANALRGYATEFGMIAAKGLAQIDALVERFSTNEEIPGIGPITALTLASQVSPQHFKSSRHFASWVGLAPRENSTGGKARLGKISKVGNERIRQLLVVGVMAIIQRAKPPPKKGCCSGFGKQDGPHRVGHDDERRKLSASAPSRLIRSSVPTMEEQ